MKKRLSLILLFTMFTFLCACGNSSNTTSSHELNETSSIEVKGLFFLDPAEELDLSTEGLDPAQRYLLLVYDVVNNSDRNEELSGFADSITLTMNNTNSYEQLFSSEGMVLKSFRENCGYSVSTSYGTLWGGSGSVRMIAAFAVNGNDIKDDCMVDIDFQLSDNIKSNATITAADIQTINLLDDVFAVEDDPEMYQVAHSIKNRAQICKTALETASQAEHNGDTLIRNTQLAVCGTLFSEDTTWGVSCGSAIVSEDLPVFQKESVSRYWPEIVDKITTVSECIETMISELEMENPNYDSVNYAQRLAYNTLTEIIDYFDADQ